MKKVLLVFESKDLGQRIYRDLERDCIPFLCHDPNTAVELLQQRPDAMILEMELPGIEAITFLEELSWKPEVILTLGEYYSPYSSQKLLDLGVGFIMRTPCKLQAITGRLRDMMQRQNSGPGDHQQIAASHLKVLGISPGDRGEKELRVAIPLLAQDMDQKISAELYPAVAKICGSTIPAVEKVMKRTIVNAWNHRDPEIWEEYFPHRKRYPTNKVFLCALAQKLY